MSPKKKVVSRSSFVDSSKAGRRTSTSTSRVHVGTVEARWDCTSCGTTNIPGFTKVCPNCSNPRDKDETYQPPVDLRKARLLSADELRAAGIAEDHLGDQQCGYCGYFSKPGTPICPYCSANLTNVARTCRKCGNCGHETNLVTCPQCGDTTEVKEDEEEESYSQSAFKPPRLEGFDWSRLRGFWWIPVVLAVLSLVAFLFWPRRAQVTVNDTSWTYTVQLQEYQYNGHEGWDLPYGADKTGEESRIHHYDTIIDGYHQECHDEYEQTGSETVSEQERVCESVYSHTDVTCYDDGSCDYDDVYETECHYETVSRQEPVYGYVEHCEQVADTHEEPRYATWYFYSIWEWVNINPAVTSGHGFEPYWSTDYILDEKHREAGRYEEYHVSLVTEDGEDTFSLTPASFSEYSQYQIGSQWLITHSGGIITEIVPANP